MQEMWEKTFARELLNFILSEVPLIPGELWTAFKERYFKDKM